MGLLKRRYKRVLFSIVLLIMLLISIELISFLYFHFFKDRYTFYEPYINDTIISEKIKYFDAQLGWDTIGATEYGERERTIIYDEDFMSTFGDSYTYCAEVDDNESWQFYLSKKINKNVYNFGVNAFGTDQAYLKFEREYPKVRTKIVTLGLISENINRVVNVFRPFYYSQTATPFTKPRAMIKEGKLDFLVNPIQNKEDLGKLKKQNFISLIGKNDYWYNRQDLPVLSFPYTRIFFNKNFRYELFHGKYDDIEPRPENLWYDKEIIKIMFLIFDNFVVEAENQGAIPIIMIFPQEKDVINHWGGEKVYFSDRILEYCQSKGYLCYDGIEVLAKSAHDESDIDSYFNMGHLSAKGNELIAESFYEFLNNHDLIK